MRRIIIYISVSPKECILEECMLYICKQKDHTKNVNKWLALDYKIICDLLKEIIFVSVHLNFLLF